jgi:N-acetylneuraminate synthase
MKAGDVLTVDNVKAIRPGLGLPPKYLDRILGKKVNCDIKCGTALSLDYLG